MSRCPLCGSKECCGGYYQEVQDVLVEALVGAKWLMIKKEKKADVKK